MNSKDFFLALDELESAKGIKKDVFLSALKTALVNAYKRNTGTQKAVDVILKPERNQIKMIAYQVVVEQVEDKETQISLEDARLIDKKLKVGDIVSEEIQSKDFGRIAAQTAKQIIMQKMRDVESEKAIDEIRDKEDQLLTCSVLRVENNIVFVEINKRETAIDPKDLMSSDRFKEGDKIKVHVKKVKPGKKAPQIILSRTSTGFVRRLLELEIPELSQGVVEIKSIAREPGYRTKIAVVSNDKNVDAVGAFVGNRGVRVNTVVAELGGEKVDIIPWVDDALELIARALNPAKVAIVQVNDDDKTAKVGVLDKMLSLAIGKSGQNVRLAARLTGWKIDIKPFSAFDEETDKKVTKKDKKDNAKKDNAKKDKKDDDAIVNADYDDTATIDTSTNIEQDIFEEGLGELD